MNKLERIQNLNPQYRILDVHDEAFQAYGKCIPLDTMRICEQANQWKRPKETSAYMVDIEEFHEVEEIQQLKHMVFGEMEISCGICHGYCDSMTGVEYHQGSEVNVAVTDCILALGKPSDLVNEHVDGSAFQLFYISKGTCIELFSNTLHYCPITCDKDGFSTVVILLKGTNTPIDYQSGEVLSKRNKWFLTHASNRAKVEAGHVVGLSGDLIKLSIKES